MRARDLKRLVAWLEQAGIQTVEFEDPESSLRVVMHAPQQPQTPQLDAESTHQLVFIAAAENGTFLRTHPCSGTPFVKPGRAVTSGDILGLLKVDEVLYKPVTATQDGRVARITTSNAEFVQEGTVLFELDAITNRQ